MVICVVNSHMKCGCYVSTQKCCFTPHTAHEQEFHTVVDESVDIIGRAYCHISFKGVEAIDIFEQGPHIKSNNLCHSRLTLATGSLP